MFDHVSMSARARSNTASNISAVSRPVFVFSREQCSC